MLTAASQPRFEPPARMVLMGVAGSGKSSVGAALALRLGAQYLEGDDLHPAENIAKMSRGEPLDDADRWPWLALVGAALAGPDLTDRGRRIVGCSALKRRYRDRITEHAGGPVTFIHLAGSRAVIETRMRARQGHFMPAALLDSQFAALEAPAAEERAVTVDIDQPLDAVIDAIVAQLRRLST